MKFLALTIFLFAAPNWSFACSCRGDWSVEMAAKKHPNIAIVKVISSREVVETKELWSIDAASTDPDEKPVLVKIETRSIIYTGKILESLKGSKAETVEISAQLDSNCSATMEAEETYIVFWSGKIATTSSCATQPLLRNVPSGFLEKLRSGP